MKKRSEDVAEVATYQVPPNPFAKDDGPPLLSWALSVDAPVQRSPEKVRAASATPERASEQIAKLAQSEGTVHVGAMLVTNGSRKETRQQQRGAMEMGRSVAQERARARRERAKASANERKELNYLPTAGERRPDALRTYRPAKAPSAHVTANVAAMAYPFLAEAGLGSKGILIGSDAWSGAAFVFDPWVLYEQEVLTNPNILVAGIIGRGKSALTKSLACRSIAVGRKVYVASDPKGEWTVVARAVGGAAIELGGNSGNRLNPLDAPSRPDGFSDVAWHAEVQRRRRDLVGSLAESSLGRDMRAVENTTLDVALERAATESAVPVLGDVVTALLDPTSAVMGATTQQLREDGRELGHALRRLVEGDLKGLFDGPSTVSFDTSLPMVSIDMSRISGSDTLIAMVSTCAAAWIESAILDPRGGQRIVVYDESWRLLKMPSLLARMQAQWKLSRAYGITNIAVIHRLSDLDAVGEENSSARNLALGLFADCSTKVIYAQERGEATATGRRLGLSDVEIDQLPTLSRGQGLWRVGERSFLVNHRLTVGELALFDTNSRMVETTEEAS